MTPKGFRDGLPVIKVSRLRATGVIQPDATSVVITFGEGEAALRRTVGLWHMHFPNGGSWSYFLCPGCGVKAQVLRLTDGRVACRRCDGLIAKTSGSLPHSLDARIARLEAKLTSPRVRLTRNRILERRSSLELSLRRALAVKRRQELKGFNAF